MPATRLSLVLASWIVLAPAARAAAPPRGDAQPLRAPDGMTSSADPLDARVLPAGPAWIALGALLGTLASPVALLVVTAPALALHHTPGAGPVLGDVVTGLLAAPVVLAAPVAGALVFCDLPPRETLLVVGGTVVGVLVSTVLGGALFTLGRDAVTAGPRAGPAAPYGAAAALIASALVVFAGPAVGAASVAAFVTPDRARGRALE